MFRVSEFRVCGSGLRFKVEGFRSICCVNMHRPRGSGGAEAMAGFEKAHVQEHPPEMASTATSFFKGCSRNYWQHFSSACLMSLLPEYNYTVQSSCTP